MPTGPITGHTLSGSLSPSGRVELTAAEIDGTFGNGAVTFNVANASVILGGAATDPLFAAAHVTAHVPALGNLSIVLDGLHLGADRKFGASQVTVGSTGFAQAIDLAGILPFDVTSASATFPNHDDLDRFDVTVTGNFDFAPLASLPFTPKVKLGTDTFVTPSTPADQNEFTFSVAIDSLSEGRVRPLDFGPLGLGFDDLALGDITVSGDISLGGYQNGVFQDTFGGNLSLAGDFGDVQGALSASVTGRLDLGADQATLDVAGTFGVSLKIGDGFEVKNADLAFALGITVDAASHLSVTGPTLQGAHIAEVSVLLGDLMKLTAHDVTLDLAPHGNDPLVSVGPGGASVDFQSGLAPLAGWGGSAGNFAIDRNFLPVLMPGFSVDVTVPGDEQLGLPDFLPLRIDEIGIRFPNIDLAHLPPGGVELTDLADFALRFSGGIEANDQWPISASVDGLEFDLGKLVRGEFPITNLDGFSMGVEPFELFPGFKIGGGLALGTIDVDSDPGPAVHTVSVFYGRVFGDFEYEGIGAGIDLVVSQFGPVLAQVTAPVGIPLDGGALGGILLASAQGGVTFGGAPFPDPQSPLDILSDPRFQTDFPVNTDTIRSHVEPAVQAHALTWDRGFTVALKGTLTYALAPGVVTGDVTVGFNVGLVPGQQGLKIIGKGDLDAFGMPFASAALLVDLHDLLAPKFDFAFATPQAGSPLGFLLPAQATFAASLDTKGAAAGTRARRPRLPRRCRQRWPAGRPS